MGGALDPAAIALWVSIGISLPAAFVGVWVAMRSRNGAPADRDPAVSILFACAGLLTVLYATAAALIAARGMAYVGVAKAALVLTAAFAVAGMALGLIRGRRSGRAIKTRSA